MSITIVGKEMSWSDVTVILVRQGFWSGGPTSPRKHAGYNGPGWGLWSGRMFFMQVRFSASLSL